MTKKKQERCKKALKRLEVQINRGTKPCYNSNISAEMIPLTDHDKIRINKEIEILQKVV